MEPIEGESCGGGGQDCPALQKLQKAKAEKLPGEINERLHGPRKAETLKSNKPQPPNPKHTSSGLRPPSPQSGEGENATGDVVPVVFVTPEKLAEIKQSLSAHTNKNPTGSGWKSLGAKMAGLVIIAACVAGELSPEPNVGQSIHAHGGHENKRLVVRRPVLRKKSDGADPKPSPNLGLAMGPPTLGKAEILKAETLKVLPDGHQDEILKAILHQTELLNGLTRGQEKLLAMGPPAPVEPISDNESVRLFALLRALELESNFRKAPVTRVFMQYCLDGKSRHAVARGCKCSPALISLRLMAIQKKLGRKPIELRQFSDQFERIADSLSDSRARRIDRRRAIDGSVPDWPSDPGDEV